MTHPTYILLDILDDRISLTEAGRALVTQPAPPPTCQAPNCQATIEPGEHSCAKHTLIDAF